MQLGDKDLESGFDRSSSRLSQESGKNSLKNGSGLATTVEEAMSPDGSTGNILDEG